MMNKFKLFLVSLIGTFAFTTPAWAGPAVVPFLVLGAGVGAAAAAAGRAGERDDDDDDDAADSSNVEEALFSRVCRELIR